MNQLKLYMLLLGCKPAGRNTEQHDIFFTIGESITAIIPQIMAFWPEANQQIHIDAWREVTQLGEYDVSITRRQSEKAVTASETKLFFINLGGYKKDVFEEYHYKMLVACQTKAMAIKEATKTAFYRHTGFKGAASHIDDKYGIDIDDIYEIIDILPAAAKEKYTIALTKSVDKHPDEIHLGYFKLNKFE